MQDTITIQILGQEYKVKAKGNEEHVQSLSRYVNEKVLDIQQKGSAVSTMELATMVMLNLADDVAQARSELMKYKESVSRKVDQLIDDIDNGMK
ncbi:MAG: cell division protein ZapA [Bacteriovoracaceae bacterium]|nr:cell division protein ZapA [Bacteriovoracaceae bacterium]HNR51326.1 cell division protein ZapA [Deltaproteobacteria bacterium]HRR19909.1 cell division protein ZapA [Desulfomonilia bacterium]HOE73221.1 cell division protein ZapA [Deltaproteobacteria bacterium]HOS26770.1 cell division protein ZapA [Deltaproteobacteria bacterium]